MLDTGCSRTMVHSDLVSDGQIREGESAVVRCAHGDTAMYPMADICVELDGYTIDTVAAVSDMHSSYGRSFRDRCSRTWNVTEPSF